MAKPELGTKRICPVTGRKFYDLNKDPVISPYTGQIVPIAAPVATRVRGEAARVAPVAAAADTEAEDTGDIELVSLEDADEENAGAAKTSSTPDDDLEIEDDVETDDDDDTFLEEDEDEGDDVTDLIGDGIEDDEEP